MTQRLIWLPCLCLAACGIIPPANQPSLARPAQAEHTPYTIAGRISVKYDGERSSASLHWKHGADTDEILLFAPLGNTMARITRDSTGVTLDTGNKRYSAADAGALTEQVLGWYLPLSNLQHWVLALSAPQGTSDIERNANGQISMLRQDGWEISYTRYAAPTPDSLPLRLTLQREGLEIQLLIDEWQIPETS